MSEFRILGPPGTGKTSILATKYVPAAIEKFGADKIMLVSFTRAAAREIATKKSRKTGRSISVDPKNVGTLHQVCFHALGAPKITETLAGEWNSEYPDYSISGKGTGTVDQPFLEDGGNAGNKGDQLLRKYNILRNKLVPRETWPMSVRVFEKRWKKFKKKTDSMDFTDLIETALDQLAYAPGRPEVLFVDEAQDMTALQLKLVRSWALDTQWLMLVGDDDQTIYRFSGASPDAFLDPPVDKKFKTILSQSYRVPQAVLNRSNRLIQKVSRREPKEYAPRNDWFTGEPAMGKIIEHDGTYKKPEELIEYAEQHYKNDESVMFLASCSYMLEQIKIGLKDKGLPFGNRYRVRKGDWNPLGNSNGTSSKELLVSFLSNGMDDKWWNVPQFVKWTKYIKVGEHGLKRKTGKAGIKALEQAIEQNEAGLHTARNVAGQILTESALQHALDQDLGWLKDNVHSAREKTIRYPIKVYNNFGLEAIEEIPRILIGTIHSVKGGESDCVILFPDISWQAYEEMQSSSEGRDAIYRVFYVGMTRAKEELVLASPAVKSNKSRIKLFVEL